MRARSSSVVSRSDERRHCLTAASQPAREKMNVIAGSSAFAVEHADHVGPRRRPVDARAAATTAAAARLPVGQPVRLAAVCDVAQQFRVDEQFAAGLRRLAGAVVEQVEQPLADHHVLPQRHGPVFVDDDGGVAAHGLDPAAELLGVAHRRRQADQPHLVGQVQDHLLPDRAPHPVGQEVHLVHHDIRKSVQRRRIRVQHVAQHLGGHHHDGRIAVDRLVTGEQADALWAVPAHQIGVLLVAQRLDRRGVEALSACGQRQVDGELADHRLAGAGRRAHQHAVPVLQCLAGALLKVVERERQLPGEAGQLAAKWRRHRLRAGAGVGTAVGGSIGSTPPIGAAWSSGTSSSAARRALRLS